MEKFPKQLSHNTSEQTGDLLDIEPKYEQSILERVKKIVSTDCLTDEQQLAVVDYSEKFIDKLIRPEGGSQYSSEDDLLMDLIFNNGVPKEVNRIVESSVDEWEAPLLTPEIRESNRLFAATLIDYTNRLYREGSNFGDIDPAKIEQTFVSFSPNAFSYIGSFESELEMLTLANKTPLSRRIFGNRIAGEVIYNHSFDNWESPTDTLLSKRSAVESIDLIVSVSNLAWIASGESYSQPMVRKMLTALEDVQESPQATPLVKFVAEYFHGGLERPARLIERPVVSSEQFPQLEDRGIALLIAKDAAGAFNSGRLDFVADTEGHLAGVSDWRAENNFNLTENQAKLLEVAHRHGVSSSLERALGFSLTGIDLSVQLEFLKFAAEAKQERFDRLSGALHNFKTEQERISFTESFMALEFGDDFGDRLLNISEKAEALDFRKLSEVLTRYRTGSQESSEWFGAFDPELQKSINLAINERMTETIALLEKVMVDGEVQVDISPNEGRRRPEQAEDDKFKTEWTSVEQVLEPIQTQLEGIEMANNILRDPETVIMKSMAEDQGFQIYRLINEKYGQALLQTRQYGSHWFNRNYEYGNRSGVEARISMTVNPNDPFNVSLKDPEALRVFGLDREGRTLDQAPDDPERDPTIEQGIVSFDTGSIGGDKESMAFKIGSAFAAGNVLRSQEQGRKSMLNHNTNFFDQEKWGQADNFAKFVGFVDEILEAAIRAQDKNAVKKAIKQLEKRFDSTQPPQRVA